MPAPRAPICTLLFLLLVLWPAWTSLGVRAQSRPVPGVVWTPPDDPARAQADLRRMHQAGVRAVRTGLLRDDTLLTLADTLGLALYQDLPLDYVPASALADTLPYALRLLELGLTQARNHPSARHFGLARFSDTSDPRACAFFERLADLLRETPNSQSYYLTPFIEADRCAQTVDLVLLDTRDASDPSRKLVRWQAAHGDVPAGIGALGTWVEPTASSGLRSAHSPEVQARYFETHLNTLLADTSGVHVVFAYRWRDEVTAEPSPAHSLTQPYTQSYGLLGPDEEPRPALDVMTGLYTGRQTTFAFPAGTAPPSEPSWAILAGWLVFLLIGLSYAFSPRFRYMVPRYFRAHMFYRDSIREGREVLLWASAVLLIALGLSMGVLGQVFLDTLRTTTTFQLLFRTLPPAFQRVGVALLAQPWLLILLLGSIYALGLALWASLLSLASRRRHPLMPGQALMLVLWARWPILLLLLGAMVVPSLPASLAPPLILGLAGGWLLFTLLAIGRTLIDYTAITYVPGYLAASIGLANPVLLILIAGLVLYLRLGILFTFAWHLATRS